ncbi:MAG: hypothetical protein U5N86_01970, partial [Planctomycetota bacterium]|nr:hypothetical protein [Planctomycetota bacterium]
TTPTFDRAMPSSPSSTRNRTSYGGRRRTPGTASTNGLTLARHRVISKTYLADFPEISDPKLDEAIAYSGTNMLDDEVPGLNMTVAQALLSPTRTYAPVLLAMFKEFGKEIHGHSPHSTGGGQTKSPSVRQGTHLCKGRPVRSTTPV